MDESQFFGLKARERKAKAFRPGSIWFRFTGENAPLDVCGSGW